MYSSPTAPSSTSCRYCTLHIQRKIMEPLVVIYLKHHHASDFVNLHHPNYLEVQHSTSHYYSTGILEVVTAQILRPRRR